MNVTEIFGKNVFNDVVMRERLPKDTYKALKRTMDLGERLTEDVADVVANAMKDWAIEKGATHYTHWFQPMTGSQPFIGQQGQLERVAEWRVELVVAAAYIKPVVAALKAAHPYEEPAYGVYLLADF